MSFPIVTAVPPALLAVSRNLAVVAVCCFVCPASGWARCQFVKTLSSQCFEISPETEGEMARGGLDTETLGTEGEGEPRGSRHPFPS